MLFFLIRPFFSCSLHYYHVSFFRHKSNVSKQNLSKSKVNRDKRNSLKFYETSLKVIKVVHIRGVKKSEYMKWIDRCHTIWFWCGIKHVFGLTNEIVSVCLFKSINCNFFNGNQFFEKGNGTQSTFYKLKEAVWVFRFKKQTFEVCFLFWHP